MEIQIPFGKEKVTLDIPQENILALACPKDPPQVEEVADKIRKALRNPVDGRGLRYYAGPSKKVVLITDDYTRPTPVHQIAPVILDQLNAVGVADRDIHLIIAGGPHRKMTADEIHKKLGGETTDRVKILQHDARDSKNLVNVGKTSRGNTVWLNKAVWQADLRIGIGMITSHFLKGYGGGPSIILPGACGVETIKFNHGTLAVDPKAWVGIRHGNPCWEDVAESARLAKLEVKIDVVLNSKGQIVQGFSGNPVEAQTEGIHLFNEIYGLRIPERAEIVITSAEPTSAYMDQCLKACLHATIAAKEGGTRIVLGYCEEGLGPEYVRQLWIDSLSRKPWPTPEEYLQEMRAGKYENVADAVGIYKLLQFNKSELVLVSKGLSDKEADRIGIRKSRSLEEALDLALKRHGKKAKITIIPQGAVSRPIVEND